jgi:hypothetical protein
MSRAFIKESENEWLGDVEPELSALERFLTAENGGVKVYEVGKRVDNETKRSVHEMSNGNSYTLDEDGRWVVVFD